MCIELAVLVINVDGQPYPLILIMDCPSSFYLLTSAQPKLFGGCSTSQFLQNSGTHLPQLMNTSCFHRNVGEWNKSLNAMSRDPFLSVVFGKGSG